MKNASSPQSPPYSEMCPAKKKTRAPRLRRVRKALAAHRKPGGARGFTLIEVVLTCCVLSILGGALAMVMSAMQLSYVDNVEISYNRILANNVADAVKRQLSCAQIMELQADKVVYVNEYGQQTILLGAHNPNPEIAGLTYKNADGSTQKFYAGKEVTLDVTADAARQTFHVKVSVKTLNGSAKGKDYVLERDFQKLNAKTAP